MFAMYFIQLVEINHEILCSCEVVGSCMVVAYMQAKLCIDFN